MTIDFQDDIAPEKPADADYWDNLISETRAADFMELSPRTLQSYRQRGGGPEFIRISSRCIRYTRRRCKLWADQRSAISTSDLGAQS